MGGLIVLLVLLFALLVRIAKVSSMVCCEFLRKTHFQVVKVLAQFVQPVAQTRLLPAFLIIYPLSGSQCPYTNQALVIACWSGRSVFFDCTMLHL